jgi:hypothetical protein
MFNNSSQTQEKIKECMTSELPEIQKMYEENRKLQNIQQKDVRSQEIINP